MIVGLAAFAPSASAATYSNPTPLGPADNAPLLPYPTSIAVTGEQGTTTKVTATLVGVSGAEMRQLDALLVGPGGSTLLVSDICSAGGIVPDFVGQTFTFDDDAQAAIPETCGVGGAPSGTYKPSNYDTADNFPGFTPPFPFGLGNFRGLSPNGTWSLHVVDDNAGDNLAVSGGWQLDVTTTGPAPTPPPVTPAVTATPKKKCKKGFVRKKIDGKRKCVRKKRR